MSPLDGQWRSLEELARDPALLALAESEFPHLAEALNAPQDRRRALKLIAASLALAGLGGCGDGAPSGHLIPAAQQPPQIVPGLPNFYSTANVVAGYASGVVVKHFMGRPIKVEGNPKHPASLGATDVFAQAQVLDFYDSSRAWAILKGGAPFDARMLSAALTHQREFWSLGRGDGLVILTGVVRSPSFIAQMTRLLQAYPQARWLQWDPIGRANLRRGAELAFGQALDCAPRLDNADVILAIDSDLLSAAPGHLRFAHDFAARRNPTRIAKMNRLYAIEASPTLTGAAADHRFIAGPRDIDQIVVALAADIFGREGPVGPEWLSEVAADLKANMGRALIHVGPQQSAQTHGLVHAINIALGARGATLDFLAPPAAPAHETPTTLQALADDMRSGKTTSLIVIDSDPVYAAGGDVDFAQAMEKLVFSLALAQTPNQTTRVSAWAAPMTHPWETWSDARAYDGTATIMQPQALPLYGAMDALEFIARIAGASTPKNYDLVRETWEDSFGADFDATWRQSLADGVAANSAAAKVEANLRSDAQNLQPPPAAPGAAITVAFAPDPHILDGRFANNAWLQEMPRPLTKLTWDNPLLISPQMGERLQLKNGDIARLSIGKAGAEAPIYIMPGLAENHVVALLGYGRKVIGEVGRDVGVDFFPLTGRGNSAQLQKLNGRVELASTDHHNLIFNNSSNYARSRTLEDFDAAQANTPSTDETEASLYRWKPEGPAAWGMSVDLGACIGCNACAVACQAENNVPVVGKDEVLRQREMHWLRIDRYYDGAAQEPRFMFQPVMCQHCEEAPCEPVCPVGATVHDSEGLNLMVYNRCIGTRFCSNNCPYKVRRFNYFAFADEELRAPQSRNPEVTVRARGVMEKCTFCLQRIAEARIVADREDRPVGEVVTACQAACPTKAISFGNLASKDSDTAQRKKSPLSYALLAEQNTNPRVTYEEKIRNLNPNLEARRK